MKRLILLSFLLFATCLAASSQATVSWKFVSALPASCSATSSQQVLLYKWTATAGLYQCVGGSWVPIPVSSTSSVPTFSTIELGNATDTTLSRASAGRLAVEGSNVIMASDLGTSVQTQLGNAADGSNASAIGFRGIPPNSQSANYTTVMADAGKQIFHPSTDANARTFTIDSNANVAYPIGTTITFINMSANNVTIAITSDTLTLVGTGTAGSRTLAQYGMATAVKISSTQWLISGTALT